MNFLFVKHVSDTNCSFSDDRHIPHHLAVVIDEFVLASSRSHLSSHTYIAMTDELTYPSLNAEARWCEGNFVTLYTIICLIAVTRMPGKVKGRGQVTSAS